MLYTERDTDLLYEAKFFDDFVMVRPATPGYEQKIERLTHNEFADRFREFWGDPQLVFDFFENEGIEVEITHH